MVLVRVTLEFSADDGHILDSLLQLLRENGQTLEPTVEERAIRGEPAIDALAPERLAFIENLFGDKAKLEISKGQEDLINALINVSWEEGLPREELLARLGGRTNRQLSGLLGALGKRISGTPGYEYVKENDLPVNAILYTQKGGQWVYRLKPWVQKALAELHEAGQVQWLQIN